MFCTKCGKQLDDGLRFCTSCGAAVTTPKKTDAEASKAESAGAKEAEAGGHEANDAEASTEKSFDLPDSALEPKTPEPASDEDRRADMETQVMEPVRQDDGAAFGGEVPDGPDGPGKPSPKQRRNRVIAISSVAAVVVAAAVAVLLVLDPFNPNTPIDSDAFPNDVIRSAVTSQLDADGDGRLSDEEAALATALVLTPEGAEFVTQGNEVDVQSIRDAIAADAGDGAGDAGAAVGQTGATDAASQGGDQDGGSQNAGGQNAQEGVNQDEGEGGQSPSAPAIGDELAPFANLKTLVATGCDLTEVDLSVMPELEYVDLRDNPGLATFDLAKNSNIKVLFCDEGAAITGLEEAGLYFTDLLTSMAVTGQSQNQTIQVEYDTHARPVLANGVAYSYDEAGRLVHAEQTGTTEGAWFESYEYGANGLLSAASAFSALDVSSVVDEYAYGYDDAGRVTQFATGKSDKGSGGKEFSGAGEFAYLDGRLAAYKGTTAASSSSASNVATVYSIDDEGLLASACKDSGGAQTTLSCSYASSGALSSYGVESAYLTGAASSKADSTEYSEAGFPVSSAVTADGSPMQVSYECNADGYITSIQWGSGDAFMAGSTGKLSYVKRVGALAGRAAERYVPVIRPALYAMDLYETSGWAPLRNWFQSTGFETPVTVYAYGPMDVANEQLGLRLNMLDCPNEVTLAAYDREHWTDGLELTGEQPIEAAGVGELLAKAAQVPMPVPAQTFVDDPVYGPVVQQYLEALKQTNASGKSTKAGSLDQYTEIPESVRMLIEMNGIYSSRMDKVFDFAYVDLNADGVNELAVTFPSDYEYGIKDGKNKVECAAVYGQVDGKPQLIANDAERTQCWVASDGHVVIYGGAAMYANIMVYAWDGTQASTVDGMDYVVSLDDDRRCDVTFFEEGGERKSVVDYDAVMKQLEAIMDANPYAQLAWTPVPITA